MTEGPQGNRIPEGGPLRIGFYSPALPDSGVSNGIVTYTRIMRDALRALGHSVVVVTTEAIEYADGRVAELHKPNRLAERIRILLESKRQDGSHASVRLRVLNGFEAARRAGVQVFEIEESFGWAGRLTGKGVAIVERLHGPHVFVRDPVETVEQKRLGDQRQRAEQESFSIVQSITAPTQKLLEAMRDHGINMAITRAIPNPMPVGSHAAWSMDRADPDQILFVGRFDWCKGADVAIRAFAHAVRRRPSLMLVMVGPDNGVIGTDGSKVHFDEFVVREVPPEVRGRIRFLGEQAPASVAELRLRSGLALVTSRFETSSYALVEAMAEGMPVLASNCFGPAEIVADGISGRLVPVDDAMATAEAITEMTGSPELLAKLGQSARLRVAELMSPDRIAQATVDVYRDAILRA